MGISVSKFIADIVADATERLDLTEPQRAELPAAVSHILQQSAQEELPFVTPSLRQMVPAGIRRAGASQDGDIEAREEDSAACDDVLPAVAWEDLFEPLPYAPPRDWHFTFIDLFAGIGGFRIAFQKAGGKCVFSSEWDKYAKQTYARNFGEIPYGDIRQIPKAQIPDHDILCGGFPCQPFSLAGVSKKNALGRKHGFEDETQGTLFFEIKEILKVKRPKAFMLENVKNLLSHDRGRTFEIIRHTLEDELGYVVNWKIVNGAAWVPQHRERLYLVGYDPRQIDIRKEEITIPERPESGYAYPKLSSIIHRHLEGLTIGPGTWDTLVRHKAHHEAAGHGFGYGLHTWPLREDEITRTISARYHKDGAEILIEQEGERPRKLSVKEAMQLQGFDPAKYIFPVSATQAYHQIGNSVVVPAIAACAKAIAKTLQEKHAL